MNYENILEMAQDIINTNKPSDFYLIQTPEFRAGEIELPYIELAVFNSCAIYRSELPNHLKFIIEKLQNYVGYDIKPSAKLDFMTAQEIVNDCDTDDLESIVKAICRLDENQLNIVGY